MLANPDLDPNATINCWIMGILMFQFVLVHAPGTMHGPDGMSQRKPEVGDKPEPDDNFDDWIDKVYGFMHIINSKPHSDGTQLAIFASDISDVPIPTDIDTPISYKHIPRTTSAKQADIRLNQVSDWLVTLKRPPDLSDSNYATFM